jgi:hypothetical protein
MRPKAFIEAASFCVPRGADAKSISRTLACSGDLTAHEAIFIDNILDSYRMLTPKQAKWLGDIEASIESIVRHCGSTQFIVGVGAGPHAARLCCWEYGVVGGVRWLARQYTRPSP